MESTDAQMGICDASSSDIDGMPPMAIDRCRSVEIAEAVSTGDVHIEEVEIGSVQHDAGTQTMRV